MRRLYHYVAYSGGTIIASGACIEASRPFWVSKESKTSILSGDSDDAKALGGGGVCCGCGCSEVRRGAASRVLAGVGEAR